MLIQTAVLGQVDVAPEDIICLPDGLFGFDSTGDFAIIKKQDDDVTLTWLQAVDSKFPCFVVFDPFDIIEDYDPVIEPSDLKFLSCKADDDLQFLVIAVVPDDIKNITVNLKSPIVINKRDRRARQVIVANRNYPIRFPLFASEEEQNESEPKEQ